MASTVWRGHLTFGLISIPVRLFRAARAERIPLKRVVRASSLAPSRPEGRPPEIGSTLGSISRETAPLHISSTTHPSTGPDPLISVRQSNRSIDSEVEVPTAALTRAVEVQKNHFVEIPADELKKLKSSTSADMAIEEFVPLAEIDPLYFETSYYVVPEEVGQRAYALLYQALVKTNVVALAGLSMHGRDHVVVIRPGQDGLVAHTMYYVSEVHLDEQFRADTEAVQQKELELATTLVTSLSTNFEPEKYKNGYQQRLQDLIDSQVGASRELSETVVQQRAGADVVDIADALRRSLAQLKKPAQNSGEKASENHRMPRAKRAGR